MSQACRVLVLAGGASGAGARRDLHLHHASRPAAAGTRAAMTGITTARLTAIAAIATDTSYGAVVHTFLKSTTEPIQLPHQPLGIPPFVYGLWFFGRIRRNQIKIPYEFLDDAIEKLKNAGYQVEKIGPYYGKYERIRTNPSIWDQLRGLQTHKMPIQYLNGSEEQRLELLQGILSTKPCKTINRVGRFAFRTKKKHLSVTVQYLSESLGAKTTLSIDKTRKTYDLKVTRIIPFLPQMGPKRPTAHLARRYVKSIERIPAQLCVHIETDEKDGTFLVGEGFIPCH